MVFKSTDGGLTFFYDNLFSPWTQENVQGQTNWTIGASNPWGSVSPIQGDMMANFYLPSYDNPITRLVTPSLDLSNARKCVFDFERIFTHHGSYHKKEQQHKYNIWKRSR